MKKETCMKTRIARMLAALLSVMMMLTVIPAGSIDAQAAKVKKPAAVKALKASNVTNKSFKISYKKAKNAKKYQIKVYQKNKLRKAVNTKKMYVNVKGLKPNTKYTVKVRSVGKAGGKTVYSKYKTIKVTTKSTADTPDPQNDDGGDDNAYDPSKVYAPGSVELQNLDNTTLQTAYDNWITKSVQNYTKKTDLTTLVPEDVVTINGCGGIGSVLNGVFAPDASVTDKLTAYKTAKVNGVDLITDMMCDVFTKCGMAYTKITPEELTLAITANFNDYYAENSYLIVARDIYGTEHGTSGCGENRILDGKYCASSCYWDKQNMAGANIRYTCPACNVTSIEYSTVDFGESAGTPIPESLGFKCANCGTALYIGNPYTEADRNKRDLELDHLRDALWVKLDQ